MPNGIILVAMWTLLFAQRPARAFRPVSRCLTLTSSRFFAADADESSGPATPAYTPWNRPNKPDPSQRSNNKRRFRQHVNPLANQFQMQTPLSDAWPRDVFQDISRSLHLDIGCSKGGFLLELAAKQPGKNYLGVEIRPSVVEFAQSRVAKRGLIGTLNFVGCNANVDLDRLLTRYQTAGGGTLDVVTIQFPDPHFKSHHVKRRVVTTLLVQTLAKFMPSDAVVFLQSDIQEVLDDMRSKFRDNGVYFEDTINDEQEYLPENYIGIPTERETSVIENGLPVYRALFRRTPLEHRDFLHEAASD